MMDKKSFDEAIGEAPPSTVDVDAAIARGRRAARMRMVVNPTVGVTAAVLVVVGAVAFTLLPGAPGATAPPAMTSSAPPGFEDSGMCRVGDMEPRTDESSDGARIRLTDVLNDLVVVRLAAGSELSESPSAKSSSGDTFAPLEFFQFNEPAEDQGEQYVMCDDDPFAYTAGANIALNGRYANIWVSVSTRELPTERCSSVPMGKAEPFCEAFTGPDGERVLARTEVLDDDSTQNVAWVNKLDGTGVEITVQNRADRYTPGNLPGMAQPPMTVDQVVEVALDPGMTVFP